MTALSVPLPKRPRAYYWRGRGRRRGRPLVRLSDARRDVLAAAEVALPGRLSAAYERRHPGIADEVRGAAVVGLVEAAGSYPASAAFPETGDPAGFGAFAATVIRRRVADAIKYAYKRSRDVRRTRPLAGRDAPAPARPPDDLDDLIACLPGRDRRIFTMTFREGMTYREVARRERCSCTTVGNRLTAGFALLCDRP